MIRLTFASQQQIKAIDATGDQVLDRVDRETQIGARSSGPPTQTVPTKRVGELAGVDFQTTDGCKRSALMERPQLLLVFLAGRWVVLAGRAAAFDVFRAMAARISAFKAFSLIFSPS